MRNKLELSEREKEIFFCLRGHFGFSKKAEPPTPEDVEDVLWAAWEAPKEELHNLGIAKFKIAQMFSKLLGLRGMTNELIIPAKKDFEFWYVPC